MSLTAAIASTEVIDADVRRLLGAVLDDSNDPKSSEELKRRSAVLRRISAGLDEVRGVTDVHQLIDAAPALVCRLGFDAAFISRIEDSTWTFASAHSDLDPTWITQMDQLARRQPQRVAPCVLEADMIRRRIPVLVTGTDEDPRLHRGLLTVTGWQSYVAAPIMPNGQVIGLLHASRRDGPPLDTFDCDVLALFAAQFGGILERAVLVDRFEDLRRTLDQLTESLDGRLDQCLRGGLEIPTAMTADGHERSVQPSSVTTGAMSGAMSGAMPRAIHLPAARPQAGHHPDNVVTPREIDVLQLMAQGFTNTRIANRLVISEGTVKSHVKHILRKLAAANRAEAVSRWLQRDSD